jgi:uncharacterized protein (DUF488 family)
VKAPRPTILTIGHSTRPIGEFVQLLLDAGVELLVDVRAFPQSRTNPQFNAQALSASLREVGIDYRHLAALGGRRHRDRKAPPSRNTFWRHPAFRNYADYAMTEAFRTGLDELMALASEQRTAIMCSEAVWWRCHRRIITDYLLSESFPVEHILGSDKTVTAELTPGALKSPDGTITYPGIASDASL